jgi:hypothetical protein
MQVGTIEKVQKAGAECREVQRSAERCRQARKCRSSKGEVEKRVSREKEKEGKVGIVLIQSPLRALRWPIRCVYLRTRVVLIDLMLDGLYT